MMDIKRILESFTKSQEDIEQQLSVLRDALRNEDKLWAYYEKLDPKFFLNERAIDFLADSLHFVNDQARLSCFSLNDIQLIYETLIRYNPDNTQYQEDLIAFVYNVQDDGNLALQLIDQTIERMNEKRKYLRKIQRQIKSVRRQEI